MESFINALLEYILIKILYSIFGVRRPSRESLLSNAVINEEGVTPHIMCYY